MSASTGQHPLPTAKAVADFLVQVTGRPVEASLADMSEPESADLVGVYRRDDASVGDLCIASLEFAARFGAALASIPVGAVDDAIKDGKLSEVMGESFYEVANICAQLIQGQGEHIALSRVFPLAELPDDAARVLAAPAQRVNFEAVIGGESAGRFSILRAASQQPVFLDPARAR